MRQRPKKPGRAPRAGIGVGLIGCGQWGPNLARNFHGLPGSRLEWLCDSNPARLEVLAAAFPGVRLTTDARDVIRDRSVDAAVVATPAATHHRLGRAVLESGRHLLVEKPFTTTSAEALDLIDLAAKRRLTLMVSHVFLFNAAVRAAKGYIERGELGRIYYLSSERTNFGPMRQDVDVAWDLLPHDLSIFSHWLGTEPERVTAKGGRYLPGGNQDVASVTLTYPGGVLAHVLVSWLAPRKIRTVTVIGEQRMLVFDDTNMTEPIRLYHRSVAKDALTGTFSEFQTLTRDGETLIPYVRYAEPLKEMCLHFLESLTSGSAPISGGHTGLRVVRTLEAIDRSAREDSAEQPVEPV